MSALAFRNYVSPEDETRHTSLTSLTDLLHVPEEDRRTKILELSRRGGEVMAALDALLRDAREGGVNLESVLRDARREEQELADSVRDVASRLQRLREGTADGARLTRGDLQFAEDALNVDQAVLEAYRACRQELEILRRRRLKEYASEWTAYLANLKERPGYAALAPRVEEFWHWISSKLWSPEATPTDDGFLMIWDRDEHHLQVELFHDGSCDWFYRNRDTDEVSYEEGLPFGRWTPRMKEAISALRGS